MNTQNYGKFFRNYLKIGTEQQALIEQYYFVIVEDFDFESLNKTPLSFSSIISTLSSLINQNVFSLVKELVEYETIESFRKDRIKKLCDKRIVEFNPTSRARDFRGDAHFFGNELDNICVKGQAKRSVATSVLTLLIKNDFCQSGN